MGDKHFEKTLQMFVAKQRFTKDSPWTEEELN